MQAQINRIKELADNSRKRNKYARFAKAVSVIRRDRGYEVYHTNYPNDLSVLTARQSDRVQGINTHDGRINAIRRAAEGGSVG